MNKHKQRNWSQYNQRLKRHSRLEVFLSPEVVEQWNYQGKRRPGGVVHYSDFVIEACLLIREYFGLGLRQTEGFVQSLCDGFGLPLKAPDYTTLSRRCSRLCLRFPPHPPCADGLVIAIDSTGLSVHSRHEWNRLKHKRGDYKWHDKWRKLHVAMDTQSGLVLCAAYTDADAGDGEQLPGLLDAVQEPVAAVCADMAYDTVRCRKALHARKARQLIPPKRCARLTSENRNLKPHADALKERDNAIHYIRHNLINGDASLARASWKQKTGYHARSHAETLMSRIKAHASDKLTNRTEINRAAQAILKCRLVNKLITA